MTLERLEEEVGRQACTSLLEGKSLLECTLLLGWQSKAGLHAVLAWGLRPNWLLSLGHGTRLLVTAISRFPLMTGIIIRVP